jgi:hypothetical protein
MKKTCGRTTTQIFFNFVISYPSPDRYFEELEDKKKTLMTSRANKDNQELEKFRESLRQREDGNSALETKPATARINFQKPSQAQSSRLPVGITGEDCSADSRCGRLTVMCL